jgi:pyrophosphatase PpaX
MMKISCVIFDLDGTITQTNELIFATFNHVARKYAGRTYTPKEIIAMFGPPEEGAILNVVGPDVAAAAMEDFYAYYGKHLPEMAQTYEGIKEILDYLHRSGIALAVFTGKGKYTTRQTLEHFDISRFFDVVMTGSDVVNHKPSAEGINNIVRQLQVNPEETLMVGDAVSDAKAAHEAGVAIASALWDSYAKDAVIAMNTGRSFHSVADLDAWLRTIVNGHGNGSR